MRVGKRTGRRAAKWASEQAAIRTRERRMAAAAAAAARAAVSAGAGGGVLATRGGGGGSAARLPRWERAAAGAGARGVVATAVQARAMAWANGVGPTGFGVIIAMVAALVLLWRGLAAITGAVAQQGPGRVM
jgi:hypothetical protein